MDIIVKSIKDIFKLDLSSWIAILVSITIASLTTTNTSQEFGLPTILYWFLIFLGLLVVFFWKFFIRNYFLKNWLFNRIEVIPIKPDESYDRKVLLKLLNNNYGDKFTEAKVELLKFIPCAVGTSEYLNGELTIKKPSKVFQNGLLAKKTLR